MFVPLKACHKDSAYGFSHLAILFGRYSAVFLMQLLGLLLSNTVKFILKVHISIESPSQKRLSGLVCITDSLHPQRRRRRWIYSKNETVVSAKSDGITSPELGRRWVISIAAGVRYMRIDRNDHNILCNPDQQQNAPLHSRMRKQHMA